MRVRKTTFFDLTRLGSRGQSQYRGFGPHISNWKCLQVSPRFCCWKQMEVVCFPVKNRTALVLTKLADCLPSWTAVTCLAALWLVTTLTLTLQYKSLKKSSAIYCASFIKCINCTFIRVLPLCYVELLLLMKNVLLLRKTYSMACMLNFSLCTFLLHQLDTFLL